MSVMKMAWLVGCLAAVCCFAGCKKQTSDSEGIRAGILHHLQIVGTLNISAMEMDFRSVSINGNQARAEVEFKPKTGALPGAGMLVAYNLEKRTDGWVVVQTQPAGGMIDHPAPGQNPQPNANIHSGGSAGVPNFGELVNPGGVPVGLPPGHPPINSPPSSQAQSVPRKP